MIDNPVNYINCYDSVTLLVAFLTVVFNIIIQEVIMEFISSNKGSLKLLYHGFSYVKQKFGVK